MSPEEKELYAMHYFDLGDLVEIDDSEIFGEVAGMKVEEGCEDFYLVRYHDNCGNPQRNWWPASSLTDADPDDSNVICFNCAKAARETANQTRH